MSLSSKNFENIYNAIPNPIIIYDLETEKIVKVNRSTLRSGINEDSLIGLPLGFLSSGRVGYTSDILLQKFKDTLTNGPQYFHWEIDLGDEFITYNVTLNTVEYDKKEMVLLLAVETNKE